MTTYKHKEGTIIKAIVRVTYAVDDYEYDSPYRHRWIEVICHYDEDNESIKRMAWSHARIPLERRINAVVFCKQLALT